MAWTSFSSTKAVKPSSLVWSASVARSASQAISRAIAGHVPPRRKRRSARSVICSSGCRPRCSGVNGLGILLGNLRRGIGYRRRGGRVAASTCKANVCSLSCGSVQLALDALDRLVETLEERGSLSAQEAARSLFATSCIAKGLACSLLADITAGDSRLVCAGATVSLTGSADPLLEEAEFVVFDLETTGLSAAHDHICELGAVRVRGLEPVDSFQSLVDPRIPLPLPVARLTGLREHELRRAPSVSIVVGGFLNFAGDALLVAHNARFDQRFLERQLLLLQGRRLSEPPLCTAALARHLLAGRRRRVGLASLSDFFGVPTRPCHRALPDAEATAQVLVHLIGLAQEIGARRLSDLRALAAPRRRRVYDKRF